MSRHEALSSSSEEDVKRMAHRISMSAWTQLALNASDGNVSEDALLKEYLLMCPYVSVDSPAMKAALQGLETYSSCSSNSNNNNNDRGLQPAPCTKMTASAADAVPPHLSEDAELSDDTDDVQNAAAVIARKKNKKNNVKTSLSWWMMRLLACVGYLLRTVILELPLLVLFLGYGATVWIHHVGENYLEPQLVALKFRENNERFYGEHTYYKRPCELQDLSTTNGADLFLPRNATTRQAYQHQLRHGFSIFKTVLQEETAVALRRHVMSRKYNLTEAERIFVIEGDNRFSFGLGTEEPAVAQAVKEIATHPQLAPAMERIMGPNPALIEMTAITSSYGAVDQYWHDDVIPSASAINFGRTFGPSYSVFIVLQNTTAEMGATGACPGTLYCSDGPIKNVCQKHHFQVAGDHGAWETGDALLMNMNSYHRGAAHTDPKALDRVMMILTFVPRPVPRAETRQMSQGITFSLRWDMWGHCLSDLANADSVMTQPWATLRALGLYKPKDADWGIDYITSASMRMANRDNGFRPKELKKHVRLGGIPWLPNFLEAPVTEGDGWKEYLFNTNQNVMNFFMAVGAGASILYVATFILLSVSRGKIHAARIQWAMLRLALLGGLATASYYAAKSHVDHSDWAHDIKANLRYASTTANEQAFATHPLDAATTFPTKLDVLIETRYGSKELAMYNDYINGHPGNRKFRSLVQAVSHTYASYPTVFANATQEYIYGTMMQGNARFLHQAPNGGWFWLEKEHALKFVNRELNLASRPLLYVLATAWRFKLSEYKYGIHRNTVLAMKYSRDNMYTWDEKLFRKSPLPAQKETVLTTSAAWDRPAPAYKQFLLNNSRMVKPIDLHAKYEGRTERPLGVEPVGHEPFDGAWIQDGDVIEGYMSEKWWPGVVEAVSAHGKYLCQFADGDHTTVDPYTIRRFKQYSPGEKVQCYFGNAKPHDCRIMTLKPDGRFTAWDLKYDKHMTDVGYEHLRRTDGPVRERHAYTAAY